MFNESIFLFHSIIIGLFALYGLKLGKEALISLLCIQVILSNLLVSKQILLLGLCATCSDVFSIGSSLCLNLLQEYYGKVIARRTIWISFFCLIFYLLMTQLHLIYVPNQFDTSTDIFNNIFGLMPRLVFASLISYLISQNLDYYLFNFFKNKFNSKYFVLRNYSSLLISQFVDTLCFTFLGLYGVLHNLFEVFIISYLVKVIAILVAGATVFFCKKWIRNTNE